MGISEGLGERLGNDEGHRLKGSTGDNVTPHIGSGADGDVCVDLAHDEKFLLSVVPAGISSRLLEADESVMHDRPVGCGWESIGIHKPKDAWRLRKPGACGCLKSMECLKLARAMDAQGAGHNESAERLPSRASEMKDHLPSANHYVHEHDILEHHEPNERGDQKSHGLSSRA
jgi:hypothetical protein